MNFSSGNGKLGITFFPSLPSLMHNGFVLLKHIVGEVNGSMSIPFPVQFL